MKEGEGLINGKGGYRDRITTEGQKHYCGSGSTRRGEGDSKLIIVTLGESFRNEEKKNQKREWGGHNSQKNPRQLARVKKCVKSEIGLKLRLRKSESLRRNA